MSEQNFPNNQREKTILNDYRWKHPATEAPLPGGKFPATIQWEIGNNGKILFKVNDGIYAPSGDQSYKKKQVEVSLYERNAILETLRRAATEPTFQKSQYIIKEKQYVREGGQGKLSDRPITQATFTIIREENGVVKLGYTRSDYKALFVFNGIGDSEQLEFVNGEWRPAVALNSTVHVLSYISSIQSFLNDKEHGKYQPKAPKQQQGGGNNYNNRQQNNNAPSFDDDIPDF